MIKEDIKRLIESKEARVGVIGLGYVGLPLAAEFARRGFQSIGFEVDARKADAINRGESYIADVSSSQLAELVNAKHLSATVDFSALKSCDAIIICVPTPLRKTKEPDISYILSGDQEILATRPTRHPRIDDLSGHDRRSAAPDVRVCRS
jgi:UDP-N-acetyl-D-glucosamine dehydrogenase